MMAQEKDTAGIYIGPGKHGFIHKQKYFERHQPMPVNVVLGGDPLDWFAASCPVPAGVSELDFAGGLRGAPTKVIRSDITGALSRRRGDRSRGRNPTGRTKGRRSIRRMARLLRQPAQSRAVYS